jgi:ribulose kinase
LPSDVPIVETRDTHACVAGSGVASPSTVVIVSGTPTVYLMNSRIEASVAGLASGVADLLLPGYFGYEFAGPEEPLSDEISPQRQLEIAFDLRSKCDALREAGVHVRRFVAAGMLAQEAPVMMQLFADVLDARIKPGASDDPAPLGAAILGALAAGADATGHASMSQTIHAMAPRRMHPIFRPDLRARKTYEAMRESRKKSG